MGSNSVDVEKYGEWHDSLPLQCTCENSKKDPKVFCRCYESKIKVNKVEWYAVPMSKVSTRVILGILRGVLDGVTLGGAEGGFRGQRFSHDIIKVHTSTGPDYVLEYLGSSSSSSSSSSDGNCLQPGYYSKWSPIDGCYEHKPSNMMLSDLRSIMNDNPGYGNCKDHAKVWWAKIKEKYK